MSSETTRRGSRSIGFPKALARMVAIGLVLTASSIALGESSMLRVAAGQPDAPAFSKALRERLDAALRSRGPEYRARTRHRTADGRPIYTNRLLLEKSPYLQQHAHNPVNWFPWGPEAFAEARRLGRPVLVSIGYATCHWCHVMEEESFDAIATAKVMNAHFIAIKVDREARPDIDSIYMAAIHAMGQRGGWPLNMFVTGDGKPFFGGTYFPPRDRGGRVGFVRVLEQIAETYSGRTREVLDIADELASRLKSQLEGRVVLQSAPLGASELSQAVAHFARVADREWGGVGRGTKFPSSLPIGLLLRESRRTRTRDSRDLALLTLDKMAAGGIHDHLGGGFHRYSTELRWLVPHFEKMLYDNALIAMSFLEAFRATGNPAYERVIRDLLDYVLREMANESGAFYSATDADSLTPEGESLEGYFFTWTRAEIEALLSPEAAGVVIAWYGVVEGGQLEGRNVLHAWRSEETVAAELGLTRAAFDRILLESRRRMLRARETRTPPLRDDKILVAWNGLMISALAQAGFVLGEARYVEASARCAETILGSMFRDGRLSRVSLSGDVGGPAFLEDYAFLIRGLIDLFEGSGKPRWIESALRLQEVQDAHYLDTSGGGYFRTADDGEILIAREKPITDGALPSGNSVAASNLSRLAALTSRTIFQERLALLYAAFATDLSRSASSSGTLMEVVSDREVGLLEVILVEPRSKSDGPVRDEGADPTTVHTRAMLAPLRTIFAPNRVVIRTREGEAIQSLAKLLPIVGNKSAIAGKTTAYVCENRVCRYPTNDPTIFSEQLNVLPHTPSDED